MRAAVIKLNKGKILHVADRAYPAANRQFRVCSGGGIRIDGGDFRSFHFVSILLHFEACLAW